MKRAQKFEPVLECKQGYLQTVNTFWLLTTELPVLLWKLKIYLEHCFLGQFLCEPIEHESPNVKQSYAMQCNSRVTLYILTKANNQNHQSRSCSIHLLL